jgi:hypothetical protein
MSGASDLGDLGKRSTPSREPTTANSASRVPNRTLKREPCLSGPPASTALNPGSHSGMRAGAVRMVKTRSIGHGRGQ